MDLETENRVAAMLMEEARRLRLQADREGVGVYLEKPTVRGRPNSRFLTATVLGVQQANRAVEVDEMWRAREKERELDAKLKNREKYSDISKNQKHSSDRLGRGSRHEDASRNSGDYSSSLTKRAREDCDSTGDGGLRDDEVEEFLHSRRKRGRGAVGSRMDEPGPYMRSTYPDCSKQHMESPDIRVKEEWERRILGPEKPSFVELQKPVECDHDTTDSESKSSKTYGSKERRSKKKKHSHKKEKKEKYKRRRKEKCSKHRDRSR